MQARTAQLQADARKYAGITKLQGTVTEVQAQIAKLMSADVDLVKLMGQITQQPAGDDDHQAGVGHDQPGRRGRGRYVEVGQRAGYVRPSRRSAT